MNPFNFTGPEFLLFYIVLIAVTMYAARHGRRRYELRETPPGDTPWNDPYRIAFLRGGRNELVRVAVVSLVDRGLLGVGKEQVATTAVGRETRSRKRIEQDLLDYCRTAREPKELFSGERFIAAAADYETELARMRLMPDEETKERRRRLYIGAAALLLFFALTKVFVAWTRGRTNVGFLVLLTILALAVLLPMAIFPRLTARGQALLDDVHNLFASLKVRAPQIRPGGGSTELAMLAAVFGISALPPENFVWTQKLFPRTDQQATSYGGGTSCGSSCGGGCGGGGCGGGCGGCGS